MHKEIPIPIMLLWITQGETPKEIKSNNTVPISVKTTNLKISNGYITGYIDGLGFSVFCDDNEQKNKNLCEIQPIEIIPSLKPLNNIRKESAIIQENLHERHDICLIANNGDFSLFLERWIQGFITINNIATRSALMIECLRCGYDLLGYIQKGLANEKKI